MKQWMQKAAIGIMGSGACCGGGWAQSVGGSYTTELQTDFHGRANWVNLCRLDATFSLGKYWQVEGAVQSIYCSRAERLLPDRQVFSNIEEATCLLTPAVLGVSARWGKGVWFVGIRNVNEDYFTSPATSLFTNSSCGIFPVLSYNYPLPNYPLAAWGTDFRWQWEIAGRGALEWETSVYAGVARQGWSGQENVFSYHPCRDGVFIMTSLNYEHDGSNYHLGAAFHSGLRTADEERGEAPFSTVSSSQKAGVMEWGYVEKRLVQTGSWLWTGMVQGGFFSDFSVPGSQKVVVGNEKEICKGYVGVGLVAEYTGSGRNQFVWGVFSDCACFSGISQNVSIYKVREWAQELTFCWRFAGRYGLQPALHFIRNGEEEYVAGILRLMLVW